MKANTYRIREYIATFKCRLTPNIILTETICARTKGEAMLYIWSAYVDTLSSNGIAVRLPNTDFWELVSLKWKRPIRPFDLSINKE